MEDILNKKIPEKAIGIWWIGQGGFIFKTSENKVIIADPYLSNSVEKNGGAKRMVEIPIKPEEVIADFLLCTHDHLDHTDPDTLTKTNRVKVFIGPSSVCKHYKKLGIPKQKIIEINRREEKTFEDTKILATFAKHTEDSVGYLLNLSGIIIYITGDTEYDEKLKEVSKLKPEIMITCINGKAGNMNVKEAALLTKEINPKIVIPMHYGMFKENTADPKDFLKVLEKYKVNCDKKIPDIKSCFVYRKGKRE